MSRGLDRRQLLHCALAGLGVWASACSRKQVGPTSGAVALGSAVPPRRSGVLAIGALGPPDALGVRLPRGFSSRVVARAGQSPVSGKDYLWHVFPDGGATFSVRDGGWIYVSNSELPASGGVGALRFDGAGVVVDAYPILEGTSLNCAGGRTPWGTWLSCEEVPRGRVWECDPTGARRAEARPALGVFKHEAAAVDLARGHVYLSEDEPDGRFYRFAARERSADALDLAAGTLEVARVALDGAVSWLPLPDPEYHGSVPTRLQQRESTVFKGGEGLWLCDDTVYLSTKGDDRVWAYDARASRVRVHYDARALENPVLTGVDNLVGSADGTLLVAEDGGDLQVVAIAPNGVIKPWVQITDHPGSEVTGIAFDPSGTRLYLSSQRGPGGGTTFEITGPFHVPT